MVIMMNHSHNSYNGYDSNGSNIGNHWIIEVVCTVAEAQSVAIASVTSLKVVEELFSSRPLKPVSRINCASVSVSIFIRYINFF